MGTYSYRHTIRLTSDQVFFNVRTILFERKRGKGVRNLRESRGVG